MNRLYSPSLHSVQPGTYLPVEMENTILFRVTDSDIENNSTARLRALLDPRIRGLQGIEYLIGTVDLILPDPEVRHGEPFLCPRLRDYCVRLNEEFPCWATFFSCQSMSLWNTAMCLIQNSTFRQGDRACDLRVSLHSEELGCIVQNQIDQMHEVLSAAGLPEMAAARETSLRAYYAKLATAYCCA